MMEATSSPETCVHVSQTTLCHRKTITFMVTAMRTSNLTFSWGSVDRYVIFLKMRVTFFAFWSFLQINMHKEGVRLCCRLTLISVVFNTTYNKFVVKKWDLVNSVRQFNRIYFWQNLSQDISIAQHCASLWLHSNTKCSQLMVHRHRQPIFCEQNQLGAQIFLICLLLFSACFGQLCVHHQEKIPYLCDTWYLSLCMDGCLVCRTEALHTRQSPVCIEWQIPGVA